MDIKRRGLRRTGVRGLCAFLFLYEIPDQDQLSNQLIYAAVSHRPESLVLDGARAYGLHWLRLRAIAVRGPQLGLIRCRRGKDGEGIWSPPFLTYWPSRKLDDVAGTPSSGHRNNRRVASTLRLSRSTVRSSMD